MPRENFRDRAVVVRSYDFGEADRVIVLLTRGHGIVRAVAKGVRRAKSRFGSRLQRFVELDVQLYPGRSLMTISQADTVEYFGARIIDDYERYTAACAVLETAEQLSWDEEDSFLYSSVIVTLQDLQKDYEPTLVLDSFLLLAMAHAGWAPSLFACAQCNAPGPHHAFHPAVGGAACVRCRPPGAAEVDPETLHGMWFLAEKLLQPAHELFRQAPERTAEAHRLCRAHLQWHVERKVTALHVMDQS